MNIEDICNNSLIEEIDGYSIILEGE